MNTLNEKLLPQGHGEVEKNQDGYRVSVSWDERDPKRQRPEHVVISQNVIGSVDISPRSSEMSTDPSSLSDLSYIF